VAGAALVAALLLPVVAHAADAVDPPRPGLLAIEPSVGLGTPLGYGGISVVASPLENLGLGAGVGLGQHGAQIAGAVRGRVRSMRDSYLVLELGASTGAYAAVSGSGPAPTTFYFDRASFLNAALSHDFLAVGRTWLRLFGGASYLLDRSGFVVVNGTCASCKVPARARFDVFLGFAVAIDVL